MVIIIFTKIKGSLIKAAVTVIEGEAQVDFIMAEQHDTHFNLTGDSLKAWLCQGIMQFTKLNFLAHFIDWLIKYFSICFPFFIKYKDICAGSKGSINKAESKYVYI